MSQFGKFLLQGKGPFVKCRFRTLKCQNRTFMSSRVTFSEYKTMEELRVELMKTLGINYPYTTDPKPRTHLVKYLPKSQSELPVRNMKDSFDFAIVPLSTNHGLRDKYTTFQGSVRVGRLLEDLDSFAGYIAYKHILVPGLPSGSSPPHVIVTVSVSQIVLTRTIKATNLLMAAIRYLYVKAVKYMQVATS